MDPDAIAALMLTRTRDDWAEILGPNCANAMLELSELTDEPHHQARGMFVGEGPDQRVCAPFPGGAQCASQPAPTLGAHTNEELRRVGFDPQRLEEK